LLADAAPLSDFLFDHLMAEVDMSSIDGRAKLVTLARPLLATIPEGVFRDMLSERLESLARHRVQTPPRTPQTRGSGPKKPPPVQARTPLRLAMAHLVQNPALVDLAGEVEEIRDCDLQGVDIFMNLVDFCGKHPNMSTAQLLELWHEHPAQPHLLKLAVWQLPGDPERQALEFRDAVTGIRLQWTEALLARLPRIVDQSAAERKLFLELQQRLRALKDSLQETGA